MNIIVIITEIEKQAVIFDWITTLGRENPQETAFITIQGDAEGLRGRGGGCGGCGGRRVSVNAGRWHFGPEQQKNPEVSTGPLSCPFARSLVRSLTHSRACGKVKDEMS